MNSTMSDDIINSLYEKVEYITPLGTTLQKIISYTIGINMWIVDPKTYVKYADSNNFEVIEVDSSRDIFGCTDKCKARNWAIDCVWELGQWL